MLCMQIPQISNKHRQYDVLVRAKAGVNLREKYWRRRAGIRCREQIVCPGKSLYRVGVLRGRPQSLRSNDRLNVNRFVSQRQC